GRAGGVGLDLGSHHLLTHTYLGGGDAEWYKQFGVRGHPRCDDERVQGHAGAVGEADPGEAAVIGLDAGDRALDDRNAERAELSLLLAGKLQGSVRQHGDMRAEL